MSCRPARDPSRPEGRSGRRCFQRDSPVRVLCFDDFAAAQAGGADTDTLGRSAYFGVDRAQVHVPAPLGDVVGMADIVSELRPLAADLTYLCHRLLPVSSELDA